MLDVLMVAILVALFAATFALVVWFERI